MQLRFTAYIFDIWQTCYGKLTPAQTYLYIVSFPPSSPISYILSQSVSLSHSKRTWQHLTSLIFVMSSAGFITSPKIYKYWTIFLLFQTWRKYGNEFWKSQESNFIPSSAHSLTVLFRSSAKLAHFRGWERAVGTTFNWIAWKVALGF